MLRPVSGNIEPVPGLVARVGFQLQRGGTVGPLHEGAGPGLEHRRLAIRRGGVRLGRLADAACAVLCWGPGSFPVLPLAGRAGRRAGSARRALGDGVRGALVLALLRARNVLLRCIGLGLSLKAIAQDEDTARRLAVELTGKQIKYKAALRKTITEGITRPAEATDLGPSAVNRIRSALDAQKALAEATMADPGELAEKGSPSATTVLGSTQLDVLDRAISAGINCGTLRVSLGVAEAVYSVLHVGQALAVLARGAWVPSGNRKLNRSILDAIEGRQLMAVREFDPSTAVREIKRML